MPDLHQTEHSEKMSFTRVNDVGFKTGHVAGFLKTGKGGKTFG